MQSFISIPGIKTLTVMEWRQHALLLMVRMCLSKSRFFFVRLFVHFVDAVFCMWKCVSWLLAPFFLFSFFCVVLCFPTSDASLCVHNFLFLFVQLVPFNVRFFIYLPDVHHGTAKSRFEFFFFCFRDAQCFFSNALFPSHQSHQANSFFFFT